jgi:hypothetical protein
VGNRAKVGEEAREGEFKFYREPATLSTGRDALDAARRFTGRLGIRYNFRLFAARISSTPFKASK